MDDWICSCPACMGTLSPPEPDEDELEEWIEGQIEKEELGEDDMTEVLAKWRADPANLEAGWFCASDEDYDD